MKMDENAQKLPAVPSATGAIVSRCVVLVFSYYFLYITIISDYGLVFAMMRDMRELAAHNEWITIKISVMMYSFLAIVGSYFVLAICRKIIWGEFFVVCGICYLILVQLGVMNVSPID